MDTRENLIRDLSSAFGMSDIHSSKYTGARYDSATGTLYCDGVSIPKHTIDKAAEYYSKQMDYYRGRANQSSEAMDAFLVATVAYNAINLLKETVKRED